MKKETKKTMNEKEISKNDCLENELLDITYIADTIRTISNALSEDTDLDAASNSLLYMASQLTEKSKKIQQMVFDKSK